MKEPAFQHHRQAALAILNKGGPLTRPAARFLGQISADDTTLSHRQAAWLASLLKSAGLPPWHLTDSNLSR